MRLPSGCLVLLFVAPTCLRLALPSHGVEPHGVEPHVVGSSGRALRSISIRQVSICARFGLDAPSAELGRDGAWVDVHGRHGEAPRQDVAKTA